MNVVCIAGTLCAQPRPLGQNNKAALMFVMGSVQKWDSQAREMYQDPCQIDIVVFGRCLQDLRDNYRQGTMVTVMGHVDVRENESNGKTYRNIQIVADEITFVGEVMGYGGGFGQSDNMDQPPPPGQGWGNQSSGSGWNQRQPGDDDWGGNDPDDDLPF